MIVELETITHKKSSSLPALITYIVAKYPHFPFSLKKKRFFLETELCGMCTKDVSLGAKSNSKSRILRKGEGVGFEVFFHLKVDFLEGRNPCRKFIFIEC